jgi:DNA primase
MALDLAHRAIRERDQVVIVEGYMDVIAAHQFGFPNVVACMGTALTPEQLASCSASPTTSCWRWTPTPPASRRRSAG